MKLEKQSVRPSIYPSLSRARAQEWNCWHPAHVNFFTFLRMPRQMAVTFGQKGAVFTHKPPPFICPTAWDKCPRPWERFFLLLADKKSGASGVSKITPARERTRPRACIWQNSALCGWKHTYIASNNVSFQGEQESVSCMRDNV